MTFCECGKEISIKSTRCKSCSNRNRKGTYKLNHNFKGRKLNVDWSGKNNHNWKGGKLNQNGYIWIYIPSHPFHNKLGYVQEHRLIMEKEINRYLNLNEIVNHKDGNRSNNNINNLELTNQSKHMKNHFKNGECSAEFYNNVNGGIGKCLQIV